MLLITTISRLTHGRAEANNHIMLFDSGTHEHDSQTGAKKKPVITKPATL